MTRGKTCDKCGFHYPARSIGKDGLCPVCRQLAKRDRRKAEGQAATERKAG